MADLSISAAPALTGANLATGDLFPVLDASASAGSKGSSMTPAEVFAGLLKLGNTSLGTNVASGVINLGTVTDATSRPLTFTQVCNNAGLTSGGLKLCVTDTSMAADAVLFEILGGAAGTTSLFCVTKNGEIRFEDGNTRISGGLATNLGLLFTFNGGQRMALGTAVGGVTGLHLYEEEVLGWTASGSLAGNAADDAFFMRGGVATIRMGNTHATTPTAQTLKAHDVTTGIGANLTLTGGTGSASNGAVVLGASATHPVGFFGLAGIVQPAGDTNPGIASAGSGTAVLSDSTFDGGYGNSYTIHALVSILKNLGILG